ncbi:MAG: outer membrane protein assembly factor BamE [Candidatus Babeliales bacterium]|nr:outer membrane protein assembly factor BamE [Candidatus Babeliales bacterium]
MKKSILLSIIVLPFLILLSGCVRLIKAPKLMTVTVGMTKNQVVDTLGQPMAVRGSMINESNQVIELWEYYVKRDRTRGAQFLKGGDEDVYWFSFNDNKLVKWCKAGDWEAAANTIQEVRFR